MMGVYVCKLDQNKGRKVAGANEAVYLSKFLFKCGRGPDPTFKSVQFDENPLFVTEFAEGQPVYRKADSWNSYYDTSDFGVVVGYLRAVTKSRFEFISLEKLDDITRRNSAFSDFQDLINSTGNHYSPSIYQDHPEKVVLTNAFDAVSANLDKNVRAYRGS